MHAKTHHFSLILILFLIIDEKTTFIEKEIGIALGMYKTAASLGVISDGLGVNQSVVSRLFRDVSITTCKTRSPQRVYKCSLIDSGFRHITRITLS